MEAIKSKNKRLKALALAELGAVSKLGSDNKFIGYTITTLKQKDDKEAQKRVEKGIQLQNQKLPYIPTIGRNAPDVGN